MLRPSLCASFSFFTSTIGASKPPADVFLTTAADAVKNQPPWHPLSRIVLRGSLCTHLCLYQWIAFALFVCMRVPADGGQSSDPGLQGFLHSFHYNPADLLCQLLPFTVLLTCPLAYTSLQLRLKTVQNNPPCKAASCRIPNKSLLQLFIENNDEGA